MVATRRRSPAAGSLRRLQWRVRFHLWTEIPARERFIRDDGDRSLTPNLEAVPRVGGPSSTATSALSSRLLAAAPSAPSKQSVSPSPERPSRMQNDEAAWAITIRWIARQRRRISFGSVDLSYMIRSRNLHASKGRKIQNSHAKAPRDRRYSRSLPRLLRNRIRRNSGREFTTQTTSDAGRGLLHQRDKPFEQRGRARRAAWNVKVNRNDGGNSAKTGVAAGK